MIQFAGLLLAVTAWNPAAVPAGGMGPQCRDAVIGFHTGTLERLMSEPEAVLAAEDRFWDSEPPQRFTQMWADANGITLARKDWRDRVQAMARLPDAERAGHPLSRLAAKITAGGDAFLAEAIPLVCGALPDQANLDIGIHFTAFVPPRSFVMGEVVVNMSADYWAGDAGHILNNLVHELFHVGYSKTRDDRTEPPLANAQLNGMLDALHNEGVATWIGYEAQAAFPAPGERDYRLLDDPSQVRRLRRMLNGLFAQAESAKPEQLNRWAWAGGVTARGYYVVGADMARTIDTQLGRRALIKTIEQGPASFVRTYNALVSEDERLTVPGVASAP